MDHGYLFIYLFILIFLSVPTLLIQSGSNLQAQTKMRTGWLWIHALKFDVGLMADKQL